MKQPGQLRYEAHIAKAIAGGYNFGNMDLSWESLSIESKLMYARREVAKKSVPTFITNKDLMQQMADALHIYLNAGDKEARRKASILAHQALANYTIKHSK